MTTTCSCEVPIYLARSSLYLGTARAKRKHLRRRLSVREGESQVSHLIKFRVNELFSPPSNHHSLFGLGLPRGLALAALGPPTPRSYFEFGTLIRHWPFDSKGTDVNVSWRG